jgi:hypothetical protein
MNERLSPATVDAELASLSARRARLVDKRREAELEVEVRRLRAAYDSALKNAVLSKQYGLGRTPAAYAQHEAAWQHALAEDAARVLPYSPFSKVWGV